MKPGDLYFGQPSLIVCGDDEATQLLDPRIATRAFSELRFHIKRRPYSSKERNRNVRIVDYRCHNQAGYNRYPFRRGLEALLFMGRCNALSRDVAA